jgi:hypothetical protein
VKSVYVKWGVLGSACLLTCLPVATSVARDHEPAGTDRAADAPWPIAEMVDLAAPAQAREPVTLLSRSGKRDAKSRRGDRFVQVSATGSNDVPEAALRAYKNAESAMAARDPGCEISWTLLAAVGRVESDHGRYAGSVLGSDGVSRPAILGLQLNGTGPVAAIHDTDNGRLDGDPVWDRAVGQMQFIPGTWARVASDGDGDGKETPNDLDDAALGAARYLCWGGFSVADDSGMARAIYSYNHSDYYVAVVMAFERGYRTGVFVIPSPPPPPGADDGLPKVTQVKYTPGAKTEAPTKDSKPKQQSASKGESPAPAPSGGTQAPPPPAKTPSPQPSPTPAGVQLTFETAAINQCGEKLCQGGRELGLGTDSQLSRPAAHDYDGDGTPETNAEEFAGLVAAAGPVKLGFELKDGVAAVYVVGDKDYRFADGSYA